MRGGGRRSTARARRLVRAARSARAWRIGVVVGCMGCGDGERIVLGQGDPASLPDAGVFGTPVLVPELAASGSDDFKPTLPSDELEIYFLSSRSGGPGNGDVWVATRARPGDSWGTPSCVVEVSSPSRETSPAVSADGLTLWVASDRSGGKGGYDIWVSTRSGRGAAWAPPRLVPELNSAGDEIPRPPDDSGLTMPLAYRKSANDTYQTYVASRTSVGSPWTSPSPIASVDSAGIDTDGFFADGRLLLYFSSDRLVPNDQDLFLAGRLDPYGPFDAFVPLTELNSARHDDRDPWLSQDGREIYFASNRSGSLKIYRATR